MSQIVYIITINVDSEVYNDSIMEIDLDINELQEFCNMAVRSHVKEIMSVLVIKLMHELALINHNFK
jgi:predicted component of type VI protein secretion system